MLVLLRASQGNCVTGVQRCIGPDLEVLSRRFDASDGVRLAVLLLGFLFSEIEGNERPRPRFIRMSRSLALCVQKKIEQARAE
jgi:hypothetical protein